MDGNILQQIIALSGLPTHEVSAWLKDAFKARQIDPTSATLDELRLVLADLLQDLILNDSLDS